MLYDHEPDQSTFNAELAITGCIQSVAGFPFFKWGQFLSDQRL